MSHVTLSTYTGSEDRLLWYFTETATDGEYRVQSKSQKNPSVRRAPLYLSLSGYHVVQSSALDTNVWRIKPLIVNIRILYDQAIVARYPTNYTELVTSLEKHITSGGKSVAGILKDLFGIKAKFTYMSSPYESFPEKEGCLQLSDIDNFCSGCLYQGIDLTEDQQCAAGHHHKNEGYMLEDVTDGLLETSTCVNMFYTGYLTCDSYRLASTTPHSTNVFARSNAWEDFSKNSAIMFMPLFQDVYTPNNITQDPWDYPNIIKTPFHELVHLLGNIFGHCEGNGNPTESACIMRNHNPSTFNNLPICEECQTQVNEYKLHLYNQS